MIDFNQPGLTSGYINLHNSTNASAWQHIRLPIYCLNGRSGPTTLVLGAMHGDEYEGPIAIENMVYSVNPADLTGRLILLPALNLMALMAGTRLTPEDGLNLNRVFPGDADGSLTERIAHMVTHDLIPLADHVIDLHSGGKSLRFAPSTLIHEVEGPAMELALKAAKAFAAPFTVLLEEDYSTVMIDAVVENAGKVMIATELGGAAIVTSHTASLATDGLRRCLSALSHFKSDAPIPSTQLVRLTPSSEEIISDDTCVFAPILEVGSQVSKGDILGYTHQLDRINQPPKAIIANSNGSLLCVCGQALVHRGDIIAIVVKHVENDTNIEIMED